MDDEEFIRSHRLVLLEPPVVVRNGDHDACTEREQGGHRAHGDGPVTRATRDADSNQVAAHVRHEDIGDVQEEVGVDESSDSCE